MKKMVGASLLAASVPGLIFSITAVPMALGVDADMTSSIDRGGVHMGNAECPLHFRTRGDLGCRV